MANDLTVTPQDTAPVVPLVPYAGDRHVRRSGDDYGTEFLTFLPQGQAWPRDLGSTLDLTCRGLADYWGTVDSRAADLLEQESDPRITLELLPDWERNWGLPDPCYTAPQSIGERQQALVMRMTMLGAQSRQFFINLAASIGYTITITEYRTFVVGIDRVGDARVYGDGSNPMYNEWGNPWLNAQGDGPVLPGQLSEYPYYGLGPDTNRFYWTVHVTTAKLVWFRVGAGGGQCGVDPHLRIGLADDLACLLNRWKPAHTQIIFDYSNLSVTTVPHGTATGTGAAAAVSQAIVRSVGAASSSGSAAAAYSGTRGLAAGTSTVSGVGRATVAGAGAAPGIGAASGAGTSSTTSGTLIWSEEFDTYPSVASNATGGQNDTTSNWRYDAVWQDTDKGYRDFAGTSWNINPNDPNYAGYNPFSVSGSVLTIQAFRTPAPLVSKIRADLIAQGNGGLPDPAWCGGFLMTNSKKRKFQSCYIEYRARWPNPGKGLFPALWSFSSDLGNDPQGKGSAEIDVLELFGSANLVNTTIHMVGNSYNPGNSYGVPGSPFSEDTGGWHTYGLDRQPTYLKFYYDDNLVATITGADAAWFNNVNMDIIINFAMDAPWFGSGLQSDGTTPSPMNMQVDYVRVYTVKPSVVVSSGLYVSAGKIYDPSGVVWTGRGIAITDEQISSKGAALWTTVKGWYPGIKLLRIGNYTMGTPSSYAAFVNAATADGVYLIFEHHLTGNPVLSAPDLTTESNWYAAMATYYLSNPKVMYGTMNEPPTNDIAQMQATYNAVRNTGYNGILFLEAGLGANGDPTTLGSGAAATIGSMHNVVWDIHCYNWESGYSTNTATITADQNTRINNMKTVTSADGTMPVVCCEMGNSTDGVNIDAGATQQIQASFGNANFSAMIAWAWQNYAGSSNADNLTPNGLGTTLTAYGTQIQPYLAVSGGGGGGAISYVKNAVSADGAGTSSTTVSVSFASAVGANNMVCGSVFWLDTAGNITISSIADDKGNSYSVVDLTYDTVNHVAGAIFYREGISNAPTTVTATLGTATTYKRICVSEYAGVKTSAALDGHNVTKSVNVTGGPNAQVSGTITPTTNGDLIFGAIVNGDGNGRGAYTAGTSPITFTQRVNTPGTDIAIMATEDYVQPTAGSIQATFGNSVSNQSNTVWVAAFKAAPVAVATTLDPAQRGSNITLSNGNLTATQSIGNLANTIATAHKPTGKYYCEFVINVNGNVLVGLLNAAAGRSEYPGQDNTHGIGVVCASGGYAGQGAGDGTAISGALVVGHVYGMAVDLGAKKIWFKDCTTNSVWNTSGSADPAAGVFGATFPNTSGEIYPAVSLASASDQVTFNFGATAYTGTPPSGYQNWA